MAVINELNTQLFYLGKGTTDAKLSVADIPALEAMLADNPYYFQEGDFVWVRSKEAFFSLTLTVAQPPQFSYGPLAAAGGNRIYYSAQEVLFKSLVLDDDAFSPSEQFYSVGDMLVIGDLTPDQISSLYGNHFKKWDAFVVSSTNTYIADGSLRGNDGSDSNTAGPIGPAGPAGDPFNVDATGPYSDINTFCEEDPGFAYFAIDAGELFFKESAAGVTPCVWSSGVPFGKGDAAPTTFFCYVYATPGMTPLNPGTVHSNPPNRWFDSVEEAEASSKYRDGDDLYMTTAKFVASLDTLLPIDGSNVAWSDSIKITGSGGEQGREGIDSGMWTLWSDAENPAPENIVPLPEKNEATGLDTWSSDGVTADWYDNIEPGDKPTWMLVSYFLNSATGSDPRWTPWAKSKIAGERPPIHLTLYSRSPIGELSGLGLAYPYYINGDRDSGLLTEVYIAQQESKLSATPPEPNGNPLVMLSGFVEYGNYAQWSDPVILDGEEGKDAGYYVIWSNATAPPGAGQLPPDPNSIIDNDAGTIDLDGTIWYDDIGDYASNTFIAATYTATTYWKLMDGIYAWSRWGIAKIKGEDGDLGAAGAGGTIIMYNTDNRIDVTSKPGRPSNNNSATLNPESLEVDGWVANVSGSESAIYLAVMTFGNTGGAEAVWSDWRVSRIKGEDYLATVGQIARSYTYTKYLDGWDIISSCVNTGLNPALTSFENGILRISNEEVDTEILMKYTDNFAKWQNVFYGGGLGIWNKNDVSASFVIMQDFFTNLKIKITRDSSANIKVRILKGMAVDNTRTAVYSKESYIPSGGQAIQFNDVAPDVLYTSGLSMSLDLFSFSPIIVPIRLKDRTSNEECVELYTVDVRLFLGAYYNADSGYGMAVNYTYGDRYNVVRSNKQGVTCSSNYSKHDTYDHGTRSLSDFLGGKVLTHAAALYSEDTPGTFKTFISPTYAEIDVPTTFTITHEFDKNSEGDVSGIEYEFNGNVISNTFTYTFTNRDPLNVNTVLTTLDGDMPGKEFEDAITIDGEYPIYYGSIGTTVRAVTLTDLNDGGRYISDNDDDILDYPGLLGNIGANYSWIAVHESKLPSMWFSISDDDPYVLNSLNQGTVVSRFNSHSILQDDKGNTYHTYLVTEITEFVTRILIRY